MKTKIGIGNPLLRDYMRHQSAQRARPLGGAALRGRVAEMFVDNEILVARRDNATIDYLVSKLGGELIEPKPVPARPRVLECLTPGNVERMPRWARVRIKGDDVPQDALWNLAGRDDLDALDLSSNSAAGTLAASLLLQERGLRGRLNHAGMPHAFPLLTATESPATTDNNPFNWPEYNGKTGITRAWQLCQALDNVRSMSNPIFVGILDMGFADLTPMDFATGPQFNLTNEGASALGMAPKGYAWHGNAVAGIATAVVNNSIGAGGVAGISVGPANQPVAMPFRFRTDITDEQIIRCLECCVAWGIQVLNMSIGITLSGIFNSIDGDWEETFQFAKDQGLIMIASAGNDGAELPDRRVYPATRSPGVITVGALDGTNNAARSDSNYGSSVDIWAPGTSIHTVPDPGSGGVPLGLNQTSAAAPIVAGIAALMKSANPSLRPDDIKTILRDTAWTDSPNPRSNRMLNAHAAVLRAINHALPAGIFEEPNDNPAAAKPMQVNANVFRPSGETVISRGNDLDYHRFTIVEYGDVVVTLNTVDALSFVSMEVIPEVPGALALDNFVSARAANSQTISFSNAPPGSYLVKVRGNGPNYYRLRMDFTPRPLPADMFELNQTRETAARIRLRKRTEWDLLGPRQFYQGAYTANIQDPTDVDWYHITDIGQLALTFPCCQISESDAPLNISLYAANGSLIDTFPPTQRIDIKLPVPECFVEIRCARATRYAIAFIQQLDQSMLPEPNQVPDLGGIPEWWPDPPFELRGWEKWLEVVIDENLQKHGLLQLESDHAIEWDLLSPDRSVLQSGAKLNGVAESVNVKDLAPGRYLLRVGRRDRAAARFQPAHRASVKFSIGPGF
jgi:subtilisin family serine protease